MRALKAYSEEELHNATIDFMRSQWLPGPIDNDANRLWFERLGMLVTFTKWLWDTQVASEATPPDYKFAYKTAKIVQALRDIGSPFPETTSVEGRLMEIARITREALGIWET